MTSDVTEASRSTEGLAAAAPAATPRPSILMVDDHPARLLTYEAILSGMPIHCVRAGSGEEALQRLLEQRFALILLDVNMPGLDGFEVARYVRAHPRLGDTPIVFVSGERLTDLDRLKGYEVGAIDYVSVPIVPEILRSKVALLVELSNRRSQLNEMAVAAAETRREHGLLASQEGASITQLRALFEHTTDVMLIVKGEPDERGTLTHWRYVDVNESALALYARKRSEIVGRTVNEVFPGHAARAATLCQRALVGGERLQHETEFNGRHLLVRMFAVDTQSVAVVCTDVTDSKRIEFALANSEKRFQALLEHCPVGVAQNAPDGRFEYVNAGFCNIVGYSREELLQLTWQQITHPDDLLADQGLANLVLAGKLPHYTIEKRYLRKDGSPVWVSLFGNFILDDQRRPIQGVGVVVDITARKEADRALEEGRQRLLLAHEAAGLGSFDWNVRTDSATWDTRARELWGLDEGQVSLATVLGSIHLEDRAGVAAAIERALRGDAGGRYRAAYRVNHLKDGKTRWVESHGQVQFADGAPTRMVGIKQDITERVEAEEALRRSEELFRELDRRKDEFLAMLAHELRNPVAPIVSVAEHLARQTAGDPQLAGQVSIIRRQTAQLTRLLDDLLDVARITRGRIELRREVFDLGDAITAAVETIDPALRASGCSLELDVAAAPMYVDADRDRLTQCLVNVLGNAVRFSAPGQKVRLRLVARDGQAFVEVQDFGRGISADFLPRVFDLFAQEDRSLDRKSGGLGVGLSVCKRLMEMQGGSVTAASEGEGRGATFTLALPRVAGAPRVSSPAPAAGVAESLRILIVDDNRDAADSISVLLGLSGHETHVVYDGPEALEACTSFQPDAVLLDIGLPGLDGFEVIRRLRAGGYRGFAIALSGYGQPEDRRRAMDAGFDAHLVKPAELPTLEQTLASARRLARDR
jgi:PAS domain S-box-containing protein